MTTHKAAAPALTVVVMQLSPISERHSCLVIQGYIQALVVLYSLLHELFIWESWVTTPVGAVVL